MAIISSFSSGLTANCTLQPPAKSPMLRIILMAMSRIRWKAVSERVIAGATVMESPVWIPIGSIFSMVHIMTTLSFLSRSNSNSYSFQPKRALSIKTSWIGEASNPLVSKVSNWSAEWTKDAPVPPRVKEGRITSGKPNSCAISFPFKKEVAVLAGATGMSMVFNNFLNWSRSSVMFIASISTPIISTPNSSQTPFSSVSIQRFKAVWPPIVGKTASTLCFLRISRMELVVRGFR